jgi:hypothetical protein
MELFRKSPVFTVPCRLKVLYDLIRHFVLLNRYEVAIPLCRMALKEFECSIGSEHPVIIELQDAIAKMYNIYVQSMEVPDTSRISSRFN